MRTKLEAYWAKAKHYVLATTEDPENPQWFVLHRLDKATTQWADYFDRHLAARPAGFTMLADGKLEIFLVPCERPEWFDSSYQSPKYLGPWIAPDTLPAPSPEAKARVKASHADASARLAAGPLRSMNERPVNNWDRTTHPSKPGGYTYAEFLDLAAQGKVPPKAIGPFDKPPKGNR